MRASSDFWRCHDCQSTFVHGRLLASHLMAVHNGGIKYTLSSVGPRPSNPASSGLTAAD